VVVERSALDRSMLEYHLETLTNRGEETLFEGFARRLAEREICPNLLPHTGPTGGGDSKVDSETYPVADTLALGWYFGVGRVAAEERWAFAFSAKKTWRPKVRSDVAKIAATGRGYTTAYFVTNQFVPDKARAAIEDQLQKKYKIDVRILDRTWICDRVFDHHHERRPKNFAILSALSTRKPLPYHSFACRFGSELDGRAQCSLWCPKRTCRRF
jgi:hypothetical protein